MIYIVTLKKTSVVLPISTTSYIPYEGCTTKTNQLGNNPIFTIDNLLTEQECDDFIALAEGNYNRKITSHDHLNENKQYQHLTDFDDMKDLINDRISKWSQDAYWYDIKNDGKKWKIYDKVRLVHYSSGQKIGIHRDTKFKQHDSLTKHIRRTKYVCLVYLNDTYAGGRTIAYPEYTERYKTDNNVIAISEDEKIEMSKSNNKVYITPKKGMGAFYSADILHEGEAVEGEKWLLIFKFVV